MSESIDADRAAEALCRSTASVFADMAFLDVSCVPGAGGREAHEVCAAIDILKPLSCRLELRMPKALSDSVVETLGSDGPGMEDAVLEMVNVLAGAFISEYFGPGATIKLELPTYLYEPADEDDPPLASIGCDAEGTRFEALIRSMRYRY